MVISAIVANHVAITTAGMFPRCGWLGPNLTRIPDRRAGGGVVALTFDDGPDPLVTPQVLDLLEGAGARATFFCIGRRAEAHPEIIAAIRERGHGIENHSYSHPNGFALRGPSGLDREVREGQDAIERSGGGRPRFFRAPAGIQNPWLPEVLDRAGLDLVSWTRRGFDTVSHDATRVAARLVRNLGAGDILLMHDGSAAVVDGRPVVLEALPRVLHAISEKGLRSESLHSVLSPDTR
jgi:peptidoglycan/xylan/chitin deacetylase (PgdA/CDA1 family)